MTTITQSAKIFNVICWIHWSDSSNQRCPDASRSSVRALVQLEVASVRIRLAAAVTDELLAAGVHVPLVRPQVAALAEGLGADVAGVRLLACVDAQVQLEAVGIVEGLVAEGAGERALLGVRALVGHQAALLAEGLPALLAAEGPLARVRPLVNLQVHRLAEALPTEVAAERSQATVDPGVVLQVDGMPERFGTLIAGEGFLARVDQRVCLECEGAGEALPTHTAHEDLLARVCVGVAPEVLPEVEVAAADLAAMWLLSCVDDGVRLQLHLLRETLSTLRTRVRAPVHVHAHVTLLLMRLWAQAKRLLHGVDAVMSL